MGKKDGLIFPRICKLYAAPCNLSSHYEKTISFWSNVHGFSFKPLMERAKKLRTQRPEIDWIDDKQLLAEKKLILKLDLLTMKLSQIEQIEKEICFVIDEREEFMVMDGIALWFDCIFTNKAQKQAAIIWNEPKKKKFKEDDAKKEQIFHRVILSNATSKPKTHWKQTLLFLPDRIKVAKDDVFGFGIRMRPSKENNRLYNIELDMLPSDHTQCQLLRAMLQTQ